MIADFRIWFWSLCTRAFLTAGQPLWAAWAYRRAVVALQDWMDANGF